MTFVASAWRAQWVERMEAADTKSKPSAAYETAGLERRSMGSPFCDLARCPLFGRYRA
jgi:hypothetical protein